ncbi:beta-ketoacyl synthase N-terminal-like domain-containing protein [Streptomyces sp. TRM76323]|uniref:Beta-ketoacyl synthase N-terminal-like domain-containing protein n=1 Tax=Streptomyces tamarix TaxID=3078565 RepID=A0ABU3QL62_9ACTN|nr:beta-ketoacyl synthase N-terminal-like domain-containing protein [Streptomyces tamarix]MDT9683122.1 beta-ketoacyl synthase N-terminal-like domain-containing protein [Streptomyces tamarix]
MRASPPGRPLVAVVGAGLAVPGAADPEELWRLVRRGRPVFREPRTRFAPDDFWARDPDAEDRTYGRVFGELTAFTPHPRLEEQWTAPGQGDLQAAWLRHSLLQALDAPHTPPGSRFALFLAATTEASHEWDAALAADLAATGIARHLPGDHETARVRVRDRLEAADPSAALPHHHYQPHALARRAMRGVVPDGTPVLVVDNICPAGLYAVDLGVRHLLAGETDVAVCGGVSSHGPLRQVYFAKMGALTPSGHVRAFDAHADGTAFSDGAAVVVLKLLERARRDGDEIHGVLAGFGGASDGSGKAIFAPRSEGQIIAMRRALAVNGLDPGQVGWVVAHGTATVTGDATEARSLAAVHPGGVDVTSDKPVVGHTGMACGVVSVIQILNGLRRAAVPAQPCFTTPQRTTPAAVRVRPSEHPLPPARPPSGEGRTGAARRVAGAFACGLGGINGHLLVQHPDSPADGLVSGALRSEDEVALIDWDALLPGAPTRQEVHDNLVAGRAPTARRHFPEPHPLPPFQQTRVAPRVAAQVDRLHLMALSLVHSCLHRPGFDWRELRARTGVFGAHHGPTRLAADSTVRCFRTRLTRRLTGGEGGESGEDAEAATRFFAAHAERTAPIGPYTLAGRMPSVALGWIANRYDLHGPTMMLDSGPDSGLAAVHVAADHLRTADLDLALVLGCSTAPPETVSHALGVAASDVAQGLFLLVLARHSTAESRGWPRIATLRTSLLPPTPTPYADAAPPRPTYLAADGTIAVLRAALGAAPGPHLVTSGRYAPAVTVERRTATAPPRSR